jgi:hypothetical protein
MFFEDFHEFLDDPQFLIISKGLYGETQTVIVSNDFDSTLKK